MTSPVIPELASEARNTPVLPTSPTSTFRCSGARSACNLQHVSEPRDAARRQRFDRPRRDRIDPNLPPPQILRQIAHRAFQRRLGHAHDVIVRHNFFRAVISHGDDAAAVFHQRSRCPAHRDQRIHADVVRHTKAFARSVHEVSPFNSSAGANATLCTSTCNFP